MKVELKIGDKILWLTEDQINMIEEGLYREVYIRQIERSKKHCKEKDGMKMNSLGWSIYNEEQKINSLREKIEHAIGGA